jgi:hypothetical protein
MNRFTLKAIGWLALLVGIIYIVAGVSLLLFFVGLFQNINSLSFMGSLNDTLNALAGFLSAILASVLHPAVRGMRSRLSVVVLIGVWVGAVAISYGSWLIITGRADVELSSYYFFFGNGLLGIWLWALNRVARQLSFLPSSITRWGLTASLFMMLGLLGLYGILMRLDGSDYSPLIMITGISFIGTGILYPIWCLWLGHWMVTNQNNHLMAV